MSAVKKQRRPFPERVRYTFFKDGKLVQIPAGKRKKRIIAAELAKEFLPFRQYPEKQVNEIIARIHPDYCTLRRLLVELGYLERSRGIYQVRMLSQGHPWYNS